jgi:acyl-CoA-binding protein
MMLKFYANFKQATEGPCLGRRPAFWDVVGKAKYDAWKNLGELPREKAMERYVDELRKIVETMSYTENVANFMGSVSDLDNVSVEDLQLVAPEAIEKVRSRPDSPFNSRETSPVRVAGVGFAEDVSQEIKTNGYTNGYSNSEESSDMSDDEFIDTVEDDIDIPITPVEHYSRSREKKNYSQYNGVIPNARPNFDPALIQSLVHLTDRMKLDIAQVNSRISALENKVILPKDFLFFCLLVFPNFLHFSFDF